MWLSKDLEMGRLSWMISWGSNAVIWITRRKDRGKERFDIGKRGYSDMIMEAEIRIMQW